MIKIILLQWFAFANSYPKIQNFPVQIFGVKYLRIDQVKFVKDSL